MAEIPLTRGRVAFVDDDDAEWLNRWKWSAKLAPSGQCYASRREVISGKTTTILMHRAILQPPPELEVDHWDGNGLNNRRGNLRKATRTQNEQNLPARKTNRSGYKGVYLCRGRYVARISANGVTYDLGSYPTAEAAYRSYVMAAEDLHGEFARLA